MSLRFQTYSFVTSAVAAAGSSTFDRPIPGLPNFINIVKIVITPSIAGSSNKAEIYKSDTYAAAKRVWGTDDYAGTCIDPMEDIGAGPVNRNEGFVVPYDDDDGTGEIHLKIYNNHVLAQTYTVTITWEARLELTTDSTLSFSAYNYSDARQLAVISNTSTQRVEVARNGTLVGSRARVDFVEDDNIVISAALESTRTRLFFKGTGAQTKRRTKWFDIVDATKGGPYNSKLDNQSVIVMPNGSDSEVGFGFRIDDDFNISGGVVAGDLTLVLIHAAIASPGTTNQNFKPTLRWKRNNNSLSAYTGGDVIQYGNNTQWTRTEGTNNIISPGSVQANDWLEIRVARDTAVQSNATVGVAVAKFGIEYTSAQ